jgi:glycosyltransferase involved in cell wall biosynthesis
VAATPIVTLVVPTYDRAHLIGRAIRSVEAQSWPHWELLVVDDASNDDTEAVVTGYGDDRIRYVRREINGGVAAAQNTGLDHASGRYVAFLHSDDELLPDKLEKLAQILDEAPARVGGVESGFEFIEPHRVTLRPPCLDGADDSDVIAYRASVHISTLLLRRDVAAAVRFDEALRGTEDRDFCIRLLRRTTLVFDPAPLVRINRTDAGLNSQPKGWIYSYLLTKYRDDIVPHRRVHAAWWFRIARAYARAGDMRLARQALRRAVFVHPGRARLWPLLVTSFLGNRVFAWTLGMYRALAARVGGQASR